MGEKLRVLFLCTANSARSRLAEALANMLADPRFEAGSAGTHPAGAVHADALAVLRALGIEQASGPRSVDDVMGERWDIVITVCDAAREHCPVLPGRPVTAHWDLPDPAAVQDPAERRRAFETTADVLRRRLTAMAALPLETMDAAALGRRLQRIAEDVPAPAAPSRGPGHARNGEG